MGAVRGEGTQLRPGVRVLPGPGRRETVRVGPPGCPGSAWQGARWDERRGLGRAAGTRATSPTPRPEGVRRGTPAGEGAWGHSFRPGCPAADGAWPEKPQGGRCGNRCLGSAAELLNVFFGPSGFSCLWPRVGLRLPPRGARARGHRARLRGPRLAPPRWPERRGALPGCAPLPRWHRRLHTSSPAVRGLRPSPGSSLSVLLLPALPSRLRSTPQPRHPGWRPRSAPCSGAPPGVLPPSDGPWDGWTAGGRGRGANVAQRRGFLLARSGFSAGEPRRGQTQKPPSPTSAVLGSGSRSFLPRGLSIQPRTRRAPGREGSLPPGDRTEPGTRWPAVRSQAWKGGTPSGPQRVASRLKVAGGRRPFWTEG